MHCPQALMLRLRSAALLLVGRAPAGLIRRRHHDLVDRRMGGHHWGRVTDQRRSPADLVHCHELCDDAVEFSEAGKRHQPVG